MSSFIAVMEQMGGKSTRRLWRHSAWAKLEEHLLLIAVTLHWKIENFFVSTLFLNQKWLPKATNYHVVAVMLSCSICMPFILDIIWFLNVWSVNTVIMFQMLGKWSETFMPPFYMLPKLLSKYLSGPSVC